jgi:phosphoserine phosphatase RsbU/P
MLIKQKLAVKISLYILTGIFSVLMLIIGYNYRISKRIVLKEAEMNAFSLSQVTYYQVENLLLPPCKIPVNLAALLENSDNTLNDLENLLSILVLKNDDIFGCCVAFEPYAYRENKEFYAPYFYRSGDSVIFKDLGENTYNYTNWNWYKLPMEKGACWGEPYFDKGGGNILMITYSVPFFYNDSGHKFRGVVTVDLALEKLKEMIWNMKVYQTGYAFLISSTGMFISRPDSAVKVTDNILSYAEENNLPDLAEIGHEMVIGATGFKKYYSVRLKEDCYIFYMPFKSSGWSLAIVIPAKVLLADIYSLHLRIYLIGIGGFLVILLIIIIISRNITIPLEKLAAATRLIGTGNLEAKLPEIRSRDEIGQLSDSFHQMQGHLQEYIRNLKEFTAARQKIESELKIAFDIQQEIIPKTFPPFPRRNDIDIYATLVPALHVGGDLYDYFFVEDDLLAICIGDVSGKGVPASLLMAISRTLFRSRTHKKMNAREIVQDINSDLSIENKKAMFVTLFLGLLNLKTGGFEYCNAGHNYPYILKENGKLICLNETHGPPLGVYLNRPFGHSKVTLQSNDRLILFTDGVTEAMDKDGEFYGEERLENLLSGPCKGLAVKESTLFILDDLAEFTRGAEQSDDIALLVLSYSQKGQMITSKTAMQRKISIRNDLKELERLNAFMEETGTEWGINRDLLFQLNMAAEEVVSNIIAYGYKESGAKDKILLELALKEDELRICITDHGIEFNPLQVPPPDDLDKPARERKVGGLGVYLIRNMMDQVDYRRIKESNMLILTKRIIFPYPEEQGRRNEIIN